MNCTYIGTRKFQFITTKKIRELFETNEAIIIMNHGKPKFVALNPELLISNKLVVFKEINIKFLDVTKRITSDGISVISFNKVVCTLIPYDDFINQFQKKKESDLIC